VKTPFRKVRMAPLALLTVLAFFCANRAEAQPDISLNPTYGSVTLKAGFLPDPWNKQLTAGGNVRTNLGGVNAYVAKAPDVKLFYTAGNFPLTIKANSAKDTTLLVNLPNGTWVANDDANKTLNPQLTFAKPLSGRYDIYVGTFGSQLAPATLSITERVGGTKPVPPPPVANAPDINLPPTYGTINLKAGFLPDPATKVVTAGGGIKTNLGGVNAYVAKAPDVKLFYTKGNFALTFHVKSEKDTTLLINLPNGTWVANDDGAGFPNPQIKLAQPLSGRYDIYVGTFSPQLIPGATLYITELK
jgi:hypothetical protein